MNEGNDMKITILGTGTSTGIPVIGCSCRVCRSTDSRDKRLRTSAMVEVKGKRILIDCGPDFRQQMLRTGKDAHIDAVLLTHWHFDHIGGIDDLRPCCMHNHVVEIYAEDKCMHEVEVMFPYCFTPLEIRYPGVPKIDMRRIEIHKSFNVGDVTIMPFRVMHGELPIVGYRIGNFVYITDMSELPESELPYVMDAEVMIVNGLRHRPHKSHQTIEQAVEFSKRVNARKAYLTHLCHDTLPHAEEELALPDNVGIAFDGMELRSSV